MTSTCGRCGATVHLVPSGHHFKWVTNPARPGQSWKCGRDPLFPVQSHDPEARPVAAPMSDTLTIWLGYAYVDSDVTMETAFRQALDFADGNPPSDEAAALKLIADQWRDHTGDLLHVTRVQAGELHQVVWDFADYELSMLRVDPDPERFTVARHARDLANELSLVSIGHDVFLKPIGA